MDTRRSSRYKICNGLPRLDRSQAVFEWLSTQFVKCIQPSRPVLLLLDGDSSHYNLEAIKFAAENKIILFCLPPHATHVAQPLDVSFFGPLKKH